jgi:SAM-dependent methyltransferase
MIDEVDNWDEHWQGLSDSAESNPAQHFRHRLLTRLVAERSPRVLVDIGSGQGDLLAMISKVAPDTRLVGLELSGIGVARTREKVPHAELIQVDLLDMRATVKIDSVKADVAVCCEVLEHLDDPRLFLTSALHALAPGATLFVTVPGGPRSAFDKLIGHRRHYSPFEIWSLLESAGLEVNHAYGAGFPFFNFYRLAVISRGRRLVHDISGEQTSKLALVTMKIFSGLLRCHFPRNRWGWQTVAIATKPSSAAATAA